MRLLTIVQSEFALYVEFLGIDCFQLSVGFPNAVRVPPQQLPSYVITYSNYKGRPLIIAVSMPLTSKVNVDGDCRDIESFLKFFDVALLQESEQHLNEAWELLGDW